MRETEPAVPPGTCWPGTLEHGAVMSPAATHPALGGAKQPPGKPARCCEVRARRARPHPALPRARCVCSGCFWGRHPAPAEISCSWAPSPFRGARSRHRPTAGIIPWLALSHGWHRPTAGITRLPLQGQPALPVPRARCQGWRGRGTVTQSQHLIPDKASPFLTLGRAGNVLRQHRGDRPCL